MLPADQHLMRSFEDNTRTHHDIFPPGHGLRTLYAVHTMPSYLDTVRKARLRKEYGNSIDFPRSTETEAVRRCVSWLSSAISDESLALAKLSNIRLETLTQLMRCFRQVLKGMSCICALPPPPLVSNLSNNNVVFCNASTLDSAVYPIPARLLDILLAARQNGGPRQVLDLVGQTLATIFQLGFLATPIGKDLSKSLDSRPCFRTSFYASPTKR